MKEHVTAADDDDDDNDGNDEKLRNRAEGITEISRCMKLSCVTDPSLSYGISYGRDDSNINSKKNLVISFALTLVLGSYM